MGAKGRRNGVWFATFGPARTGLCHWCGKALTFKESTLDHVKERWKGGGNGRNLVISCLSCNLEKARLDQGFVTAVELRVRGWRLAVEAGKLVAEARGLPAHFWEILRDRNPLLRGLTLGESND